MTVMLAKCCALLLCYGTLVIEFCANTTEYLFPTSLLLAPSAKQRLPFQRASLTTAEYSPSASLFLAMTGRRMRLLKTPSLELQ